MGAQQGWRGRVGVLADRVSPAAPRLLAGRTSGPVFLAGRRPTRAVPTPDLDPVIGRARLSYRRAAQLFQASTGWTLHQLRHSAFTPHPAEEGTNLPLLLARSRHASVRSLERYAAPDPRRPPVTSPKLTRSAGDRELLRMTLRSGQRGSSALAGPDRQRLDTPSSDGTVEHGPCLLDDPVMAVAAEQLGVASGDLGHRLGW